MPFKDTKDGQTHHQNDGCGEPEHNEMNNEQKESTRDNWIKCRFCGSRFFGDKAEIRSDGILIGVCDNCSQAYNEQNDQWKCECGETVTANGEHLCKNKIIDNAVRDICSVSVTAAPKSKVRKILKVALSRTRSDALLEAVELISQIDAEYQGEDCRRGFNETKEKAISALRKKINDPNDEIIQKILKDLPTLPEKMKRIDESKE